MLQVGVDLVEESMWMIEGLQLVPCTQSSQYVLNEVNWVKDDTPLLIFCLKFMVMNLQLSLTILQSNQMVNTEANTGSLEERIRNLEFQNRQQESQFYASQ